MRTLLVAAGGGGDAIAAAALAHAAPETEPVGIATLAWDRLIVDPLPGPRSAADFTGLEPRLGYRLVTPETRPIPPAGSTLPRLSRELPLPLVLLDASSGAVGLQQQLAAAATDLGAAAVRVVDVGGDILGRPGDDGLRSPLADAMTAAACDHLPTKLWLAGPGLDGELPETLVLQRISRLGGRAPLLTLDTSAWPLFLPILAWHPSEATALLAAASHGYRGTVEIRDAGLPVHLTDNSATAYELPLDAVVDTNPLVAALTGSRTFVEAEHAARTLLGKTELDEEREKAARVRPHRGPPDDIETALTRWEAQARARGVQYVTYRRLAEALGHPDVATLRRRLAGRSGQQCPLWTIA